MIVPSSQLEAMAVMKGEGRLRGTVKFYSIPGGTLLAADVTGLPKNERGAFFLQIHEDACTKERLAGPTGQKAPEGTHDAFSAGCELPLLNMEGRAFLAVETDRFFVADVVGHNVAVHGGVAPFRAQPPGKAGKKIASGVVRWV